MVFGLAPISIFLSIAAIKAASATVGDLLGLVSLVVMFSGEFPSDVIAKLSCIFRWVPGTPVNLGDPPLRSGTSLAVSAGLNWLLFIGVEAANGLPVTAALNLCIVELKLLTNGFGFGFFLSGDLIDFLVTRRLDLFLSDSW